MRNTEKVLIELMSGGGTRKILKIRNTDNLNKIVLQNLSYNYFKRMLLYLKPKLEPDM